MTTTAELEAAAALLATGELVAFPTETVYGLGADATDDRAVARIFEAKGRPHFNPLIAHFASLEAAEAEVIFDARARAVAAAFWPGPLTLVLPRRAESRLSLLCSAGLDTQAVRVPDHPVALGLLRAVGRPLAAPSANPSGRVSPDDGAACGGGAWGAGGGDPRRRRVPGGGGVHGAGPVRGAAAAAAPRRGGARGAGGAARAAGRGRWRDYGAWYAGESLRASGAGAPPRDVGGAG
jgi:tRNA threonylcarbamoyl adenosine modification protein (Sua5/YciO/YrdC/YwlC family)